MYTVEKGYIIKEGVKLSTAETVDLLYALQNKADRWDRLGNKIGKFYESDEEFIEEDGNLLDIGEIAAIAFGYL